MKECWINVYKYYKAWDGEYAILHGTDQFRSREAARYYLPSMGLTVAYRIHVKMKPIATDYVQFYGRARSATH